MSNTSLLRFNPSVLGSTQAPTQASCVEPKPKSEIKTTRGNPKNKPYSKTKLKKPKVNPSFNPSLDPRTGDYLKTKPKKEDPPPEALVRSCQERRHAYVF